LYFDKRRYIIPIKGGTGQKTTEDLRGMVVHMIVRPDNEETMWSLVMLDKDDDEMIEIKNYTGRLDKYDGVPLGKDKQEKVTLVFTKVSANEDIKVIFMTREIDT